MQSPVVVAVVGIKVRRGTTNDDAAVIGPAGVLAFHNQTRKAVVVVYPEAVGKAAANTVAAAAFCVVADEARVGWVWITSGRGPRTCATWVAIVPLGRGSH